MVDTAAANTVQTADIVPEEYISCNLCGADNYLIRFPDTRPDHASRSEWEAFRCTHPGYGIHPQIVICQHCGLGYANPRVSVSQIEDNYESVEDPVYLRERGARVLTFEKHLKAFERYTGPANGRRLLDVGAYIGVFVEVAQKVGWDAWGIEPSYWGSSYAQGQGLNVAQGMLSEAEFEAESFEVLTMWDVIEHMSDPLGDLRHAYNLLKPGGWIAVHTMDMDSLFARIMGKRWPWLMEMHVYYFTRRTLAAMLEEAGFEVLQVKPEGRYLRLKYLVTRLRPYSKPLADFVEWFTRLTGLDRIPLPVNFGDLVTAYARKPTAD